MDLEKFKSLDYGTKPSTSKYEAVDVDINPDLILKDWGDAYARDMERRNVKKYEGTRINLSSGEVPLDGDLVFKYFANLLKIRVDYVNDECHVWRQAKRLAMPAWIQFVISEVGLAYDRDRGLKFVPHLELNKKYVMPIDDMLLISVALLSFSNDGKPFFTDAFPRKPEGDIDLMSQALIESFVRGNDAHTAPVISYVTAFLGFTLRKEAELRMLYRITYDDVEFIRSMLVTDEKVLE